MKIRITDISPGGMKIAAGPGDKWFSLLLKDSFGETYHKEAAAKLRLDVSKTVENVDLCGDIQVNLRPACDRCLEEFDFKMNITIKVLLSPHPGKGDEEKDESGEDTNFSFYRGDEIDLSEVIREQVILAIPMRYVCSEDCKGLCPNCGEKLKDQSCGCTK